MKRIPGLAAAMLLLTLSSCNRKDEAPAVSTGSRIAIIGHGGMGNPGINNPYQLNSFIGITNALDVYRLDGVEADIQLSQDSTLFLLHDDYLDLLTFSSGCVVNADSAFIAKSAFRPVGSGQFRHDPVTSLESLFAFISSRRNRVRVFLDVHDPATCITEDGPRSAYFGRMLRSLDRLLRRYNVADRIAIQSGNREMLDLAQEIVPGVSLYLDNCQSLDDVGYAVSRHFTGVAAQTTLFSADLVAEAHEQHLIVQLYNAGSQRDIVDALRKGPDYFLADNLVLTQQIAETENGEQ